MAISQVEGKKLRKLENDQPEILLHDLSLVALTKKILNLGIGSEAEYNEKLGATRATDILKDLVTFECLSERRSHFYYRYI